MTREDGGPYGVTIMKGEEGGPYGMRMAHVSGGNLGYANKEAQIGLKASLLGGVMRWRKGESLSEEGGMFQIGYDPRSQRG